MSALCPHIRTNAVDEDATLASNTIRPARLDRLSNSIRLDPKRSHRCLGTAILTDDFVVVGFFAAPESWLGALRPAPIVHGLAGTTLLSGQSFRGAVFRVPISVSA